MLKARSCRARSLAAVVIAAALSMAAGLQAAEWQPGKGPLFTRWAKDVSPAKVWPEYPRPQMVRSEWQNLNGLWDLAITKKDASQPESFDKQILVPFPVESALSGVMRLVEPSERVWYRRTFKVPEKWNGQRVLLHFEAADWDATVLVNGQEVTRHKGCYDPFTVDITGQIKAGQDQTIVVSIWDPTNEGGQPLGKQTLGPGGCFYTRSTGIWQTVWLEAVPQTYIKDLKLVPDIDKGVLRVTVAAEGDAPVQVEALAEGQSVVKATGKAGQEIALPIPNAKLWSPDSPFLYDLKVSLDGPGKDSVQSYFGMRKISVGPDDKGITRILLNNKFVFQVGPLDQGFWPEGLHTPPTDEAMRFDLEMTKKYGFNMVRKHIKVEPARWYYYCDKLGLAVWQDMPAMPLKEVKPEAKKQYAVELERMIGHLHNYPSIVMWIPFNEAWGQHDTPQTVELIRKLDPSRIINDASGWVDEHVGDILDHHTYPVPGAPKPEARRASVIGEYGGLGYKIPEHSWTKDGWGYDLFVNQEALNVSYEGLCDVLYQRIATPGISGAVYTQTTDIETEINGLMTYDREIFKINPEWSAPALKGATPPRKAVPTEIFIGTGTVELACARPEAEIRFTTDGSEPTKSSTRYEKPITLTADATIKTRAFWSDGAASRIVSYPMKKVEPIAGVKAPESARPGLQVQFFDLKGLDAARGAIGDAKSTAMVSEDINLSRALAKENYMLKFDGFITVPASGVYTFFASSDDRASLTVAGQKVINDPVGHGHKTMTGAVALAAGTHPISAEYVQTSGGQDLRLEWVTPGGTRQSVPAAAFSHVKTEAMVCLAPRYTGRTPMFVGKADVRLECPYRDAKIHYTTDGSEPNEKSTLLTGPIAIDKDTTIKARAYAEQMSPSPVETIRLVATEPVKAAAVRDLEPGLTAKFYELPKVPEKKGPEFEALTPARTYVARHPEILNDQNKPYGIVFDGYLKVAKTGVYSFTMSADDGAQLRVGNKTVIEGVHWTEGGSKTGFVALEAGAHPFQLRYFQGEGGQALRLEYEGPTGRGGIPAEMLGHGK